MRGQTPARERLVLAIDTADTQEAERLASIAHAAGARTVKMGLELSSATSWRQCSELAARHNLNWIADAKLHDIPNTVTGAVRNLKELDHAPFAITMHTSAGETAMRRAQEAAGPVKMLGVTVLTSIANPESRRIYGLSPSEEVENLALLAAQSGLAGIVASPQELTRIYSNPQTDQLFSLVPGVRSLGTNSQDQARTGMPLAALERGADLLVIGRQVTQADDPEAAFRALQLEVDAAR